MSLCSRGGGGAREGIVASAAARRADSERFCAGVKGRTKSKGTVPNACAHGAEWTFKIHSTEQKQLLDEEYHRSLATLRNIGLPFDLLSNCPVDHWTDT
eukprot:3149648-Rhodomonas_salina.1